MITTTPFGMPVNPSIEDTKARVLGPKRLVRCGFYDGHRGFGGQVGPGIGVIGKAFSCLVTAVQLGQ